MTRTPPALRLTMTGLVGITAVALLSGCFAPAPTAVQTPEPTPTEEPGLGEAQNVDIEPGSIQPPPADEGFTVVIDDLHVISIEVPEAWTDVDGAPYRTEDGQQWAALAASTDLDAYFSGYDVSGMEYASAPLPSDTTDDDLKAYLDIVTDYLLRDCQIQEQGNDYDDTAYIGFVSAFYDCGGVTDAWAFGVVAVDYARTHVVYVRGQMAPADDEQAIYDQLVYTFQSTVS